MFKNQCGITAIHHLTGIPADEVRQCAEAVLGGTGWRLGMPIKVSEVLLLMNELGWSLVLGATNMHKNATPAKLSYMYAHLRLLVLVPDHWIAIRFGCMYNALGCENSDVRFCYVASPGKYMGD